MKFIFQKFNNDIYQQELIDTCKKRLHDVLEVGSEQNIELTQELKDFSHPTQYFGKGPINWKPDYFYFFGSVPFVNKCNKHFKNFDCLKSYFDIDNFLCTNYFSDIHEYLFNDRHGFYLASTIPSLKWMLFEQYSKDALIFMRPNNGEKSFNAGLFDLQYFDKDWENISDKLQPNDLILVSTPKNIRGEWRFVVNDQQEIITGSTYKYGDKLTIIPSYPEGAYKKCKEILTKLKPPAKLFTVDICEDNDGDFWLLEINSFFSAGLYASDKNKILDYLEKI